MLSCELDVALCQLIINVTSSIVVSFVCAIYICMPHLDVSSDTQSSAIIYVLCGTDRPSVFGKVCPRVLQSYSAHMQAYLSL